MYVKEKFYRKSYGFFLDSENYLKCSIAWSEIRMIPTLKTKEDSKIL